MNSISIATNKTLKLQNVLSYQVDVLQTNLMQFNNDIDKMISFINAHGGKQIGPLIQLSNLKINGEQCKISMEFMIQVDKFLHNVTSPYR